MAYILKALGLSTFDNELENRDGDLFKADNVNIDADNVIESRRGFNDFSSSLASTSKQLMTYKDRILVHFGSTIQFDSDGAGTFSSFSGSYSELEDKLRIKYQEVNGNLYFTTDEGIKKISALAASEFSTSSDYITNAGGVKAVDLEADLKISTGGFLPAQSKCAYRLVWSIKDKNNNQIPGTPSSRFVLENTSSDINIAEEFTATVSGVLTASQYFLFSSSTVDYFCWFNVGGSDTEPQTTETIGRTAIEAVTPGSSTTADAIAIGNAIAAATSDFDVDVTSSTVTVTLADDTVGDVLDAAEQVAGGGTTNLTITTTDQGSVTSGSLANTDITFTVPQDVTSTDHFYQLYRTANVTAILGLTLDDIDPGEEFNLVFESGVTTAEISAGEVTFEDITPDSFRASGTPLYTNPNTGEGILQANDRPPIARDIELFRNTTFYGNTKTVHRLTTNMLSVSSFTTGSTQFIVGNSTATREYTFVGATQVQQIDSIADSGDSLNGDYFLLNSARNSRKYYVWYKTSGGAVSDPAISERIGIKVEVDTGATADDVATATGAMIALLDDFSTGVSTNEITITLAKNGNADNAADGDTGFTFNAPSTAGDGEDAASNDVLLSSLGSVGQAIDETARSLVKVINKDASSEVNAFYLSGANDLPGIIFLEARSLTDDTFYLATNDSSATASFNPELSTTQAITSITFSAGSGSPANINDTTHNLTTGTKVYVYDSATTPVIRGMYSITVVDADNFTIPINITGEDNPSSAVYFLADVPSDNEVSPNRLYYSKDSQPEAIPLLNYIDIGRKDKIIHRIIALRDNLFVLKEDGVYIVTGSSYPHFGSRLLDGSSVILSPDTADVLNNQIYCLSSQGVVRITESGVNVISRRIEDKILGITNDRYNYKNESFAMSYEGDRAYILFMPTETTDTNATQAYRYNVFTNSWTRWEYEATCGVLNSGNNRLYIGQSDRNYIQQERKNGDRTDFSDRDFTSAIAANGSIDSTTVEISSLNDVDVYDVLQQTQYVTISIIQRLLKMLDGDDGFDDVDYESTLSPSSGANMKTLLDALNIKLVADDSSGTITAQTFSSDFATQQTEYNAMIVELNTPACDGLYTNYQSADIAILYEAVITATDSTTNFVTLNLTDIPILEGSITIYKHIPKTVEWMPIHFGDPAAVKQIRDSSIIFDQNNFYGGKIAFNSDLSQDFDEVDFNGRGVGFWGGNLWGESSWGGEGSEVPLRTYLPKNKQRARYIRIRLKHFNAREIIKVLGISLEPRLLSKRGYR